MAASERLKTSRKAACHICMTRGPDFTGQMSKKTTTNKQKQITLQTTDITQQSLNNAVFIYDGILKTYPIVDKGSFHDCTKSLLLLRFIIIFNSICFYF